jgi:hypothetical protein
MDQVDRLWRELYEEGGKHRIREILRLDPTQAKSMRYGTSLLHLAAGAGYSDEVTLLLDNGADLQFVDQYGDTPLHLSASRQHANTCRILLERGASLVTKNAHGQTPMDLARRGSSASSEEEYALTNAVMEQFWQQNAQ